MDNTTGKQEWEMTDAEIAEAYEVMERECYEAMEREYYRDMGRRDYLAEIWRQEMYDDVYGERPRKRRDPWDDWFGERGD